jgi:adenine-specific DNA-methyltransferase
VNYIGSKRSLLPSIGPFLDQIRAAAAQPRLLDIFSGTGIVSQFGRMKGFDVVANDLQEYARVTAQALLEDPAPALLAGAAVSDRARVGLDEGVAVWGLLESLIPELEAAVAAEDHPFVEEYVEGGRAERLYLSRLNGLKLAGARDLIEDMLRDGRVTADTHDLLVAGLLEGIDRVANTASVYGAYLKKVKKSAQNPFRVAVPRVFPGLPAGRALRGDANETVRALTRAGESFSLMYVDPPYNSRLYASNYHLLETIARWDLADFTPRGKTGLRPREEGTSDYCSKRGVRAVVLDLLTEAPAEAVLFSYSDEGLLPHDDLVQVMLEAGFRDPQTTAVDYKRFRADKDSENRVYSGDDVVEYLIYARR